MITNRSAHRYAVYFSPAPDSADWDTGSRWLGRCAKTGQALQQPMIRDIDPKVFTGLTTAPRRYGWHATLKAPFILDSRFNYADLRAATTQLAKNMTPIPAVTLNVEKLGDFIALVPDSHQQEISAIATACVTELHRFALPLSEAELARRRQSKLSPAQDAMMLRWGYPYVLEHFRFHLTLTDSLKDLPDQEVQKLMHAAKDYFARLATMPFSGIALFAEPYKGAAFDLIEYFELG